MDLGFLLRFLLRPAFLERYLMELEEQRNLEMSLLMVILLLALITLIPMAAR